nr:integrase, catalytic region, zinc finger, CCHC-type, peptidase aspartic, catalytic [Tanacetum cinerariifolium]
MSNVNSDLKCASCNGCLFSDNHDACVVAYINYVNDSIKSKSVKKLVNRGSWQPTGKMFTTVGHIWKPTGWTFTLVGNMCPLTRLATTIIVPPTEPIPIASNTNKPVITLVYSRKSKATNKRVPVSNSIMNKSLVANKMEPNNSWGSSSSNVPSSLIECRNDHVAKIMGYGDYQIGNVTISQVYYVKGLGHNLFSVGQFCDSDLEVAFRQHTCFIHNLDGVDLLTGSQGNNLYTLSLQDMMASSPIYLLSKASKTKSWLWHHRSKDEAPDFIIKFLKMIQVRLKVSVHRTDITRITGKEPKPDKNGHENGKSTQDLSAKVNRSQPWSTHVKTKPQIHQITLIVKSISPKVPKLITPLVLCYTNGR